MISKVIYEDANVLVVHKPAGMATQTGAAWAMDLVSELKNYLKKQDKTGKAPYLGVVHRLDQPVEGLLVFAKTPNAAKILTDQLAKGALGKHYYAVVLGKPELQKGTLEDYLIKNKEQKAEIVECGHPEGKKAVLHYEVIGEKTVSCGQDAKAILSLVDISIETGRFHQIRAQMAHAGFPLLADAKYGSEEVKRVSKELMVKNVALCAYEVQYADPVSKQMKKFQIQPKDRIYQDLQALEK